MTTDIFDNTIFTKNQKEIMSLAYDELCAQLSKEHGCKIDSVTIYVDMNRDYIHYDRNSTFTLNPKTCFGCKIMSGQHVKEISGRDAEIIYSRYLDLVSRYSIKFKNSLVCHSLL